MKDNNNIQFFPVRFRLVIIGLIILVCLLIARMVYLTVFERGFLLSQGDARSMRVINVPAYRGMIVDRNGEPLAISTPVNSVWINPQDFPTAYKKVYRISRLLGISVKRIYLLLKRHAKQEFVYLKRSIDPNLAQAVQKLSIPGVYLEREYKRYYPTSEVAAHVVGFTNIDDQGQEGLELVYNNWLQGIPGKEKVLKDRYRHVVAVLADISNAKSGHNLKLSLDSRIQFLAYRTLKQTVKKFHAESGSVVVLNPKTGEILAMVNQPSYNPNNRPTKDYGQFRNRAVTDTFEPGSTMKAFSIASALDSGKYQANTKIDTNPGWFMVGHNEVTDSPINHGIITVTQALQKSSNVAVAKMTLSLPPEHLINLLRRVGFGERTRSGFPGESSGYLIDHDVWRPFVLATLAFGYGVSVTPLQLTQAYSLIANDGLQCPATFLKQNKPPVCQRIIDKKVANDMLHMLEAVVQGGTGTRARIKGYRVAGKTGTAYIAGKKGYNKKRSMARYTSSFVGIAPVSNPQLVVSVIIRDPKGQHYGAIVAAPAFEKIMGGALRALNIAPDRMEV